mgnify:CR=1 FL=1
MKKTQFIELVKTISKTKVTFFSIILFVTMSIALFLGIGWSGEALIKSTETYFSNSLLHDAQIQTVYGYEKDKINDLLTIDKGEILIDGIKYNSISEAMKELGLCTKAIYRKINGGLTI